MPTRKPKPSPKPKIVLPPMPMPPGWFMPFWLDEDSWGWDAERRRFAIVLNDNDLLIQIVARRGVDWSWRVERMETEVVTMDFGFRTAMEARRDVLAVFWSDLWDGGSAHEQWRNANLQRFRQRHVQSEARRPAVIASRVQWAAAIEDGGMFAVGDRVHHHTFGQGSVAAVDGSKLIIDFDHAGRKIIWDSAVSPGVAEPKQA